MTSTLRIPLISPNLITEAPLKLLPDIPEEDLRPFYRAVEDLESKVAIPLWMAKNLQSEYAILRPSAIELLLQIAEQLNILVGSHPEIMESIANALKGLEGTVGPDRLRLLGPEADIFQGTLKMVSLQFNDFTELSKLGVDIPEDYADLEELVDETIESAVDTQMCLLPVIFLLTQDIDIPIESALDNARTLTQWANSFTLNYVRNSGQLIRSILLTPENSSIRPNYYSKKIEEFVGSGPKGIYQTLLEERKLDAQRE